VEKWWIKQAQGETFPKREREGCLLRLSPQNGDDGLLRMDGRLRFADELSYNTRHPILLPKEHVVTRLIIKDAHEELGHGSGVEQDLTLLRLKSFLNR
jgi:hypothetical protein